MTADIQSRQSPLLHEPKTHSQGLPLVTAVGIFFNQVLVMRANLFVIIYSKHLMQDQLFNQLAED